MSDEQKTPRGFVIIDPAKSVPVDVLKLRDQAALAALQGLCADPSLQNWVASDFARISWQFADAFIAARQETRDE
jgi:hypothetical protein